MWGLRSGLLQPAKLWASQRPGEKGNGRQRHKTLGSPQGKICIPSPINPPHCCLYNIMFNFNSIALQAVLEQTVSLSLLSESFALPCPCGLVLPQRTLLLDLISCLHFSSQSRNRVRNQKPQTCSCLEFVCVFGKSDCRLGLLCLFGDSDSFSIDGYFRR